MYNSIVKQFFDGKKELTLLNGRDPIVHQWTSVSVSATDIVNHKGNLGWKLGDGDLVLDIDPRNNGDESYKRLCKDFGLKLEPTVITASGGIHIYCQLPIEYVGKKFHRNRKEYPGIDFLTKGKQCVIPGCKALKKYKAGFEPELPEWGEYTWADEDFGCLYLQSMDKYIDLIKFFENNVEAITIEGDDFGITSDASWPIEKVRDMLYKLDNNMPNDEWVKVGMALQNWDDKLGLELFEEWSIGGDTYKEGETEKRWSSFKKSHGVTIGTLYYMSKDVDIAESILKVDKYVEKIMKADVHQIEHTIIGDIKREGFGRHHLERIAKCIQDRFKVINNFKMPISVARDMIFKTTDGLVESMDTPAWCHSWVYVNSLSAFVNKETLTVHKTESFNLQNGINVPASFGGSKLRAITYISDNNFIEKVEARVYLPMIPDLICEINGSKVLNIFNPKTIPIAAESYTKEGITAIELIKKHLLFIFGTEDNASIMLNWLAHNVQFPGVKILYSPIIQGIEGIGKSFFGELLRSVLGDTNVGTVSSTQIISDFNGWAQGKIVNIVEEIRVKGQNRYEAVNAIKPLITDRMIQINEKNVKPYVTPNTINYLFHTNFKDAVPLGDDDRRWWVIFAAIQNLKDLRKYVGQDKDTYFPLLFNSMRDNCLEVRKWLLEHKIPKEFMEMKQAPMTDFKELMIATEETGFEGLQELKELIKKGGQYFNDDCISSSDLFETFMFEYPEVVISDNKKHLVLKKLGYLNTSAAIKIDGKARRIWVKRPMTNDEIRNSFEF